MADIESGFADLAGELETLCKQITDKGVKRKALEAGAKPIVDHAKRIMGSHKRTGRLHASIGTMYNEADGNQDIGASGGLNATKSATGFYGRFLDRGYHPNSVKRKGKKIVSKARTGKFVKIPFLAPALEAEKEAVHRAMMEVYKNEIGG